MIDFIDNATRAAEQRYSAFLLQVIGQFQCTMGEPAPTAASARGNFRRGADTAQTHLLTQLATDIDKVSDELVTDAFKSSHAHLSEPQEHNVLSVVDEARSALVGQIMLASEKDIEVVGRALRQLALSVDNYMSTKGTTYVAALFGAKTTLDTDFRFSQIDTLGRKWASTVWTRSSVRSFLINTYIDTYLYALASRGIDMVAVKHPEEGHPHAGLAFSISGTIPGIPAYQKIKSDVWHPNSRALVSHP